MARNNTAVKEVEVTSEAPEVTSTKAPARPPVADGYITPVQFAKALSEAEGKEIKPQVVYSYLKNAGEGSKHPLPRYEVDGRQNLLKLDEAMAWWNAKAQRVIERKANAAAKASKKAEATETE